MNRSFTKRILITAIAASMTASFAAIPTTARTIVFKGDYDMDGVLTSSDALGTLRMSIGLVRKSNAVLDRIDIDNDGLITSNDALNILRDSVDIDKITQSRSADAPYTVNDGLNDFSAQIFKRTYEKGSNTLVSPFSIYTALAMLENGANAETKNEMLDMLGGGSNSVEDINEYMNQYIAAINSGDILNTANSMYIMDREDIEVKESFVNEIRKDYFAEVFREPATDDTVDKINNWIKFNTKDMIDNVLDKGSLTPDTVALLLNAVSFRADWSDQYDDYNIRKNVFHNYDGTAVNTDFLYGEEYSYISDELSEGFIKKYDTYYEDEETGKWAKDEEYSFIAILPNEGVSVDDYIAQMNDSTIRQLVDSKKCERCKTIMPKFKYECTFELKDILSSMGMKHAFNVNSDFSSLAVSKANTNIGVSNVIHKTFIDLDESGTKAAAVTVIVCTDAAAPQEPEKMINLDRPFIYVIYDMNNNVPVFIGTVCTLEGTPAVFAD